jgi:hypothetical protein
MRFTLFAPRGSRRLTPHVPMRMATLISFWVAVALFVLRLGTALDDPSDRWAGHILVLLYLLLVARSFRRALTAGVFADEKAVYLCRALARIRVELDEIQALTLRPHALDPRVLQPHVLWLDLTDGRRYPTPAYLGDVTPVGIALTRSQMDALIADLTRLLPRPAVV